MTLLKTQSILGSNSTKMLFTKENLKIVKEKGRVL